MLLHASCVDIGGSGVLLRGGSGTGKSDLALRLIDRGALLIADDQVELRAEDGTVIANAPALLVGMLEVRGLGVLRLPAAPSATVAIVVDLVPRDAVARMPEPRRCELLGVHIPAVSLAPFSASAGAFVRAAVAAAADPARLVQ